MLIQAVLTPVPAVLTPILTPILGEPTPVLARSGVPEFIRVVPRAPGMHTSTLLLLLVGGGVSVMRGCLHMLS